MRILGLSSVKAAVVLALLCLASSLNAQDRAYNAYSPYSMFGIGDLYGQGTAYNKSMGGVGIAARDKRNFNYLNPASITAREERNFMADFGLTQGNRYYAQGNYNSCNNTFNISNLVISFPIYKSLAFCAGFTPYSDIGYSIYSKFEDPEIIGRTGSVTEYADGEGGLGKLFFSTAFNPFKGFSVGIELDHLFGTMQKTSSSEFNNTSFRSINSGYLMHLKANSLKLGVQYDFPVGENTSATIGATYKMAANLLGTVKDFEYTNISSVLDTTRNIVTDLSKNKGMVKLASEVGLGVSLRGNDSWSGEINYSFSDWSKTGMTTVAGFANTGKMSFAASKAQSLRGGVSFVPNRNDIRYYRKRITYRAGTYWDRAYYLLDGHPVDAIGITLGATLPVYRYNNNVTFGVDFGQRGTKEFNMIRERYINFHIGIDFFEYWFAKPKYD